MNKGLIGLLVGLVVGVFSTIYYFEGWVGPPRQEVRTKGPFGLGRAAVCEGSYEKGLALLDEYLETWPNGRNAARAGLFKGKALLALGRFGEAETAWSQTATSFPETLDAHKCTYKLGQLYLLSERKAEAQTAFYDVYVTAGGPLVPEAKAFWTWLEE